MCLLLRWLLHWLRLRGSLLMRRVRGLPALWFCIDWRVLAEDSCESAAQVLERGAHIPLREILVINEARIVDVHVARLDAHVSGWAHVADGRAHRIVQRQPEPDRAVVLFLVVKHRYRAVEHHQRFVRSVIFHCTRRGKHAHLVHARAVQARVARAHRRPVLHSQRHRNT